MSDLLTETAPEEASAAPDPVGSMEAPEADEAVVEASGGDGKSIPVERFNGLMSKFNKTQAELRQEQEARALLEHRIQELESQQFNQPHTEADVSDPADIAELKEQVSALNQMLLQAQLENAKAKVFEEFPEAKPFADLISASDEESLRALAKDIAERTRGIVPAGKPAESGASEQAEVVEEPPVNPDVPVAGSGPGLVSQPVGNQEKVAEAIKKRDFLAFLAAKREAAGADSDLVLS